MVVFHLIFSFTVGGAETMLVDIANKQCTKAHVRLIVINNNVDNDLLKTLDPHIKITLLRRPKGSKLNLIFLFKLWYIIVRERPSVLHCHNPELFPLLTFWKSKTCLTLHDVNEQLHHVKKFNKIFAISKAVAADITLRDNLNSTVIYNGILIHEYQKRADYTYKKTESFKLIQISRLMHTKKGQDVTLRSVASIVNQHPDINIKLTFVGDGDSLPYLQRLATELGITSHVEFLGVVTRDWVKHHLNDYHLLLQPSLYEGFGLTIIEGIAAGLPVIVTALDGPQEILHTLSLGTFCAVNDHLDLAEKIMQLYRLYLDNKVSGNNNIISNSDSLNIFDIEKTAESYLLHYKTL